MCVSQRDERANLLHCSNPACGIYETPSPRPGLCRGGTAFTRTKYALRISSTLGSGGNFNSDKARNMPWASSRKAILLSARRSNQVL